MSERRRRLKQFKSLEDRLVEDAKRWRAEAKLLQSGAAQEALLQKAKEAQTTAHASKWLRSPSSQPRK
jgi:hypothetical protein